MCRLTFSPKVLFSGKRPRRHSSPLLSDAQRRADDILDSARQQANKILEQARDEAQQYQAAGEEALVFCHDAGSERRWALFAQAITTERSRNGEGTRLVPQHQVWHCRRGWCPFNRGMPRRERKP